MMCYTQLFNVSAPVNEGTTGTRPILNFRKGRTQVVYYRAATS